MLKGLGVVDLVYCLSPHVCLVSRRVDDSLFPLDSVELLIGSKLDRSVERGYKVFLNIIRLVEYCNCEKNLFLKPPHFFPKHKRIHLISEQTYV